MIYLIIAAVVVWALSWIVRGKNPKAGVALSWTATGIALVGFVMFFLSRC